MHLRADTDLFAVADKDTFGISPDGNSGSRPHLIVCPVNLLDQWMGEIHRWFKFGSFSVLPYTGSCKAENREAFWREFAALPNPMNRRIIIATIPVSPSSRYRGTIAYSFHPGCQV